MIIFPTIELYQEIKALYKKKKLINPSGKISVSHTETTQNNSLGFRIWLDFKGNSKEIPKVSKELYRVGTKLTHPNLWHVLWA